MSPPVLTSTELAATQTLLADIRRLVEPEPVSAELDDLRVLIDPELRPGAHAAWSVSEHTVWLSDRLNRAEQVDALTGILDELNFPVGRGWSAGPELRLLSGGAL